MSKVFPQYKLIIKNRDICIACSPENTILRALIDGGVFFEANCGGKGTCGKCRVQVVEGRVLDKDGNTLQPGINNTYLACKAYPQEDLTIVLPQKEVSQKAQEAEIFLKDEMPLLRKVVLAPEYPSVVTHYSFQVMLRQALAAKTKEIGLKSIEVCDNIAILRKLNEVVETKPEFITITLLEEQIIAVEAGDTSSKVYGVAFDIGTTTVVGLLVDLIHNKVVSVCSKNNPQASMGADVISRIQATHELLGGLEGLAQLIRSCMNTIISELCTQIEIAKNDIYALTIAGNTTMAHLILEISPSTLVRKPYAALFNHIAPLNPQELEIEINSQGKILILPNIASFIGSDTTAGVLATNQDIDTNPTLLVDLGTNGEMVLSDGKTLYACSTAAGPAFEGAHIRDGMRAAPGAIASVEIAADDVYLTVIGDTEPIGICGSGMVRAIAELIKAGIINANGRFDQARISKLSPNLVRRLKKRENQWEFVLAEGDNTINGRDISVTQFDIRQIQLVKSSICTGVEFLANKLQLQETECRVHLAGAFGNYIDIDSALILGLLPNVDRSLISSVGNAAGTGAVLALSSLNNWRRCKVISKRVEYLELAAQPGFQKRFLANLSFPNYKG